MSLPRLTCPECWGEGTVEVPALPMVHEADTEIERCPRCGGERRVQVEECPDCRGEGEVEYVRDHGRRPEDHHTTSYLAPCDSCDGVGVKVPGPVPGKLVPLPLELLAELLEWEDGAEERESTREEAMQDVA